VSGEQVAPGGQAGAAAASGGAAGGPAGSAGSVGAALAARRSRTPRPPVTPGFLRARAVLLLVAGVAAFVIAGTTAATAGPAQVAVGRGGSLLPVVQTASRLSHLWDCPGPLPVGPGAEKSFVDVVDPGSRTAVVSVAVTPVAPSSAPLGASLSSSASRSLTVPAGTEQTVALPTTGLAGYAAVSVLTGDTAVAVSEVVTGGVQPLESPCELGTSVRSYLAPASTADRSDLELAIADPTATPAVVNVHAFVKTQQVSPPPLQGLSVPAGGVTVVDLAHYVVQQQLVGLSVTANGGRVAIGGLEHVFEPHIGAGNALVTGVGLPRSNWVLPPGPGVAGKSVLVRVLDPGTRATTVTVLSPFSAQPTSEISLQVAAGSAAEVAMPVPASRPGSAAGAAAKSGTSAAPPAEGPITVLSSEGVGVVVSTVTSVPVVSSGQPDVAVVGVPAEETSTAWLLPGATSTGLANDDLEVSNPGSTTVHVVVDRFNASGMTQVATLDVPGGTTAWVKLWETIRNTPVFSLRVTSSGPVSVSQAFTSKQGRGGASGIPAVG